jgi:RHS repeat-associated protein
MLSATASGLRLVNLGVLDVYGPREMSFEQINNSSGTVLYLHHDQAGSTRLLTGSTGKTEGSYSYSAYGTPEHTGTATTPLGYDGQYTSPDTGLVYLRTRVYDPSTAQFLSVDPLEMVTRAPYTYAEDNPVNGSDPTGLSNWNPFSESFWTEGNVISESPLNPIPYYEKEIESYEDGCGYFASVTNGIEGAFAGAALFAGGEGADEADVTVADALKGKLGSITRAPLPPGSSAWADIQDMSIADVRAAAKAGEPGYKTILKQVQQAMTMLDELLQFCVALNDRHASYRLSVDRPEAVRLTLDVPGGRWEFDFFSDGHIELERYIGQGVVDAGAAELEAALGYYESD